MKSLTATHSFTLALGLFGFAMFAAGEDHLGIIEARPVILSQPEAPVPAGYTRLDMPYHRDGFPQDVTTNVWWLAKKAVFRAEKADIKYVGFRGNASSKLCVLNILLNDAAARRWQEVTSTDENRHLAMFILGKRNVIGAPQGAITNGLVQLMDLSDDCSELAEPIEKLKALGISVHSSGETSSTHRAKSH